MHAGAYRHHSHEAALRTALAELPGWSGMFGRMEAEPAEAPANTSVKLIDYVVVHAILTESSLRSAAATFARVDAGKDETFWRLDARPSRLCRCNVKRAPARRCSNDLTAVFTAQRCRR